MARSRSRPWMKLMSFVLALALTSSMTAGLGGLSALADNGVPYVDEYGQPHTTNNVNITRLGNGGIFVATLETGWYVVDGRVDFPGLTVSGDVNLILADGCDMMVHGDPGNAAINVPSGASLTIWSQSGGTGRLTLFTQPVQAGTVNSMLHLPADWAYPDPNVILIGAGIGGGFYSINGKYNQPGCGTISIHGGIITGVANMALYPDGMYVPAPANFIGPAVFSYQDGHMEWPYEGTVDISGGTISAVPGVIYAKTAYITGGSADVYSFAKVTNKSGTTLHSVAVNGLPANKKVDSIKVSGTNFYGSNAVWTDSAGYLYLWIRNIGSDVIVATNAVLPAAADADLPAAAAADLPAALDASVSADGNVVISADAAAVLAADAVLPAAADVNLPAAADVNLPAAADADLPADLDASVSADGDVVISADAADALAADAVLPAAADAVLPTAGDTPVSVITMTIGGVDYVASVADGGAAAAAESQGGAPSGAPYVDANQQPQYADSVKELTGSETTLTTGWYIANGTLDFGDLVVSGDVNLILADGCSMTATGVPGTAAINVGAGNSLTIWSQAGGTGSLTVSVTPILAGTVNSTLNLPPDQAYPDPNQVLIGAGIGGGFYSVNAIQQAQSCGTVTVNGGVINGRQDMFILSDLLPIAPASTHPPAVSTFFIGPAATAGLDGSYFNYPADGTAIFCGGTLNVGVVNAKTVFVTGGSVNTIMASVAMNNTTLNPWPGQTAVSRPVSYVSIYGLPASARVSGITVNGAVYGSNAVWTSPYGWIYLWLPPASSDVVVATDAVLPSAADAVLPAAADAPVSVITVTIDGVDYVATVGDGGAEAAAQPKSGGAPYVDADKQPQNADNATPLTGGETTLTTGWYIANGKLDYGQLTVSGDVNLILADGCEMTATSTDSYIAAIGVSDGNSLTIWSQSGGTGKLTASVPIISDAHIPYYPTAAIGGRPCGTIVVNGGVLTATGGFGGGMNTGYLTQAGNIISYFLTYNHTGNIEINGGTVVSTVFSANAITITGGTISRLLTDLIGNYPIILLSSTTGVTDGSGTQLRQVTVSGLPANSAVSSITVDGAVYGSNAVWTDADGKLYLWLPPSPAPIVTTSGLMNRALPPTASTLIITIDGADYTVALTGAGDETVSVQQQGGTPYVDADKQPQYADNVTELNGSETTLTTGWYIANGTLDYGSLVVSGDVNLILADGCDMTATSPNYDIAAIGVSDGNSLTVWSQAGGTGKLTANVPAVSLSANPSYLAAAIGGGSCGTVVINGGVLATVNGIGGGRNVTTMWGSDFVAHSIKYNFSGNVVINGGTVVSMIMAAGVTVTGGSMNGLPYDLFNPSAQVSVTDGSGIQLRRVTVSGLPANAAVSSITVDGAAYGSNAVWTDADGMLYLWLPPSPADVIVSASAIQPAAIQPAAGKAGLLRMPPTASTVIITIDGVDYTVTLTGSGDETVTAQPPGGVPYVDANKQPHYAGSVTALDGSETTLTTGWYIAEGTLDYGSLVVSGDVNLILADGCVMTVTSPDVNTAAINVSPGNSLTIWSQAGGTGSLAARANLGAGIGGDGGPSVGDCGTVTINGGVVSAISSVFIGKGNGVSDPSACAIEINGGTLHGPSIHAGTVCVSGGTLEVSAFHPAVGVVTDITGNELRSVRVNGLPAKAAVSYISTDVSAYGTNAVWTNAGGSLFLWLPQSAAAAVITIDGADYSVTLKGSGDETVTAQQGGGGPVGAPYVDANKQAQYADSVTELTGGETTLTTGWYIANGTLDFGNLVISGDVNLILADGCDMTATGTDPSAGITVNPGNSLTVWSQAGGTGRLTAKSLMANGTMGNGAGIGSDCNYAYAGVGAGTIIINGGIITATECYPMSGLGGGGGNAKIGAVEINGGTVNASGINGDNVVITGGSVLVHYYQYQTSAKDASGRPLSMIRVSGLPAGAAVSAVSSAGDAYDWETYGTNAMWTTDASTPFSTGGELYLWLPSDVYVIAITIDGLAHMLFRPSNWAADSQPAGEVPYSDANRQQQHASNVTRLDGSETALTTGWYVADGTLVYKNSLVISGDVNLILADGCDMTVMSTGDAAAINVSPGNSLTIWSQSEGTGKLTADPLTQTGSMSYGAGIGGDGNMSGPAGGLGTLVINGGIVYAVHNIGPGSSSSGGNFSGSMVRINGGTVYAISIDSETVVTGGSVMLSMYNPKNASGNPLIGVNVGGLPAGAAVSDIKVDGAAYGSNGVWTDDNNFIQNSRGNLLIYIPPDASSISVTVGGVVYDYYMVRFTTDGHLSYSPSGAVLAGGDRVFTLTPFPGYKLASLTDDGIDVTDRVVDGTYTIQNLSGPHTLAATTEALPPPDGSHFSFAPKSAVYNGGPQGVTVSCDLSGIGDISVRYNNSRTIPTDPGTYEITVSTSANAEYGALINYDLGAYTILPLQAALEGSVAVTGTPIAGYAITADTSGITSADPGELSYQWFIDGAPVSGATDRAYAPAAADVGKALTVTVTAANYSGSLTSAPVTVAAAGGGATYVDAHKWPMYASDVTQLDGSETTLTTGWYIASGALDFGNIIISGDVKLILADGCDMTVTGTDPSAGITVDPGNSLTVWSQAGGTGRLTAKSLMANGTMGNGAGIGSDCNYGYAGVGAGTIVINGGVINVNDCYSLGSGGGNAAVGTVEINAGTVGARSILGDNVVITGGSVYVRNYLYQMSAKDASGRPVSMIRVSGLPAGAPVSVVSADTALASAYGTSAMWTTDASSFSTGGELFLWLPTDVSVITIKINGVDYIVSRINNWAANPQPAGYVFYNDANRQQQYASDVKVLDGSETALTAGWYVAYGTLVYKNSLVVSGDVNLILADGCDMTVMSAGDAAAIGVSPGNSLTLWSQSEGTGKLTADTGTQTGGYGIGAGIGGDGNKSGPGSPCGTVVINGGIVYAGSHGIGSGGGTAATYGSGALRINGGTLFSITNNCGSVVVTGGNVMSLEHGAKDASGNPVDGVYVGGLPAGAAVSAITVDGAAYGSNGVWTDDNNYILNSRGNLRIFIPAGTSSISVTVGGRVYVYYMVTVTSDGSVSISPSGAVLAGERVFTIDPYPGYKLTSLTDNGTDVTGQVADGTYTIPNLSGPHAFTATTEALPPPDASHFSFTPQSAVYNGGPQGVTVSSDLSGIGVIYVYYNNSMTVPTDPGTYEITIYVNPGSEYGAGRNLDLGAYTILPDGHAALEGAVAILGTPRAGNTLTADTSGITSPVPGALAYQWFINGAPISGATGPAYTPTESDVGRPLTVTVTAANYSGGLTSAPVTVLKPGPSGVPYLDANGQPHISYDAAALTGSETTLTTGWYVANGTLDFGSLVISGDVHLILADGCDMTATGTGPSAAINVAPGNSLTIYAQSSDPATMGGLTANANYGAGIGGSQGGADNGGVGNGQDCGAVTINGGNIKIPDHYGTDIGGGAGGAVSGNGGNAGAIVINGGYITASSGFGIGSGPNVGSGYIGSGGSILITGGTIYCTQIYTDHGGAPNNVTLTGGSVNTLTRITDGEGNVLWPAQVSGLPAGAAVSAVSIDGVAYGSNGVWTGDDNYWPNSAGNLYIYVPADADSVSVTVNGRVYDYYMVSYTHTTTGVNITPFGKTPFPAGSNPVITITPWSAYRLASLTDNGINVTDQVVDGKYTIQNLSGPHTIAVTAEVLPMPDASHFSFTPHSAVYNGSPQGVTASSDLSGTGQIMVVYYNNSRTVPTDPGTYEITIYVAVGTEYIGGTFDLGAYTILPAGQAALEGAVAILGTPRAGNTLTADTSGITSPVPGALAYQWFINGAPISGATGPAYTPTESDVGRPLTVTVTAANYSGGLTSAPVTVLKPGPSGVPYLDANGQPQIAYDAAALTGSETTLTTGWYVANGTLDFGNIIISGDVHLILADGCDMTATGTGPDAAINVAPGNSLTIYAQSSDPATMGSLTANAYSGAGIGGNQGGADNGGVGNGQDCGTVTINGGNITIPYHYGTGIGGGDGGNVSGNGGSGGTVTINGGYSIIRGIHGIGVGPNGGSGFGGTGGSVLITGGTVFTSSIYTDLYPDPNVVITGGNVRASIVPAPSGVDGKKLYEFEVSGLPVGAAVSAISADGAAYGSNCVWTDDSSLSYNDGSNLSLWLPSDTNSISLTVGGQVYDYYVVTVTTNNGYVLTSPYGKTPLLAGSSPVFTITLYPGYVLSSLTDNGADVTDQVVDGTYTILNLSGTHALTVSTEALPIPDVSHFSFAPHSTPYNGSPQSVIVYCDLSGVGEIQHIFYNGSETIPAEPGDYAIKIYVYPSAEYGGGFYDLGTYTITPPAPPALEGTVSIGGTPQAGMTLTADTNITSPDTGALSYQWFIDGAPITDATGPTYAPTASDAGKALTVTVIAANYSGSLISAPVTVAVAAFALTVVNGTDDTNAGPYAAGTPVSITAGQAPAGQVFDRWTGGNGGAFADVYGMTTTFTMPANAATVTATYKAAPPATYALTVVNGADDTNAGPYTAGTSVSITADPAPAGQVFDRWTGGNGGAFADAYSMTTVFTMPANAATISATYKNAPPATYALTVVNGVDVTGDGNYAAGVAVSIMADPAPAGMVFDRWTGGNGGAFADAYNMTTTFTMPANAATVSATYKNAPPATYALTVVNGVDITGDGNYAAGVSVSIMADPAPNGMAFDSWTGGNGGAFADLHSMTTAFTMPANAATVSATYKNAAAPVTLSAAALPAAVTLGAAPQTLKAFATLSGGTNPTGNIVFNLLYAGTALVEMETIPVTGNGTYTTPVGYTLPADGTYSSLYTWKVSYSGDAYNSAAAAACDVHVTSPAAPALTLTAAPSHLQTYPGGITLTAALSGAYPGNSGKMILFRMNGSVLSSLQTGPDGSVSFTIPAQANGTYSFDATYYGDAHNAEADAEAVSYTVNRATPVIAGADGLTAKSGQTLANVDLSGVTAKSGAAAVPGVFTWEQSASSSVGPVGTNTSFTLTFTPNDAANYVTVTGIHASILVTAADNPPPGTLVCNVKSMAAKIGKPVAIPFTWDGAGALVFTSSNAAVCSVSQSGTLTPLKAGIAVITITTPAGDKVVFAVTVTA